MNDPQAERELKPQEFEFESMNLQVGVRLQFITHRRLKPVQHFSTLIGWVKDEYMQNLTYEALLADRQKIV